MKNSIKNSLYRLYYNQDGTPKFYTMEDLPGNFIYVDHQTFEQGRYDIVIKKRKIVSLADSGTKRYVRVKRQTPTTVRCDPDDITIIADSKKYYLWDYRSD